MWVACGAFVLLFVREMAYAALQGVRAFVGLVLAQVVQVFLRQVLAATLIWMDSTLGGQFWRNPPSGCTKGGCGSGVLAYPSTCSEFDDGRAKSMQVAIGGERVARWPARSGVLTGRPRASVA